MKNQTPTSAKKAVRNIARNVHLMRKDNHLAVEVFAGVTGLAPSTVRRAERAYQSRKPYNPQLSTLVKLSTATGVSIDDMVERMARQG